jgi:hypothetical protein
MCAAKIRLSKKEQEMVTDAGLILTKNRILQEWVGFFARWQEEQVPSVQEAPLLIPEWTTSSPKISRGENYRGLPWVVLDYPRAYKAGHFSALRSLFWWGQLGSITLHVSGPFKNALEARLLESRPLAAEAGWRICVSQDEWQHHDGEDNYRPAATLGQEEWTDLIRSKSFCKLACFFKLEDWEELPQRWSAQWTAMLKLVRV